MVIKHTDVHKDYYFKHELGLHAYIDTQLYFNYVHPNIEFACTEQY